jgi:hypothetical protein
MLAFGMHARSVLYAVTSCCWLSCYTREEAAAASENRHGGVAVCGQELLVVHVVGMRRVPFAFDVLNMSR